MQEVVTPDAEGMNVLWIVVLEVPVHMMSMQAFGNATRLAILLAVATRPPVMRFPVLRVLFAVGALEVAILPPLERPQVL